MTLTLLFTLISACLISGTMAKYVSAKSGSDGARVAMWGVEVTGTGSLFSDSYERDDTSYGTLGAKTVLSSNSDNVVAPGTSGSLGSITITGTPEVACRISVDVDAVNSKISGWDYDLNLGAGPDVVPYEPIIWSIDGTQVGNFAALLSGLSSFSYDCAPGTDLSTVNTLDISWVWPFFVSSARDLGDTYYGDMATDPVTTPKVNLVFNVTVTQID